MPLDLFNPRGFNVTEVFETRSGSINDLVRVGDVMKFRAHLTWVECKVFRTDSVENEHKPGAWGTTTAFKFFSEEHSEFYLGRMSDDVIVDGIKIPHEIAIAASLTRGDSGEQLAFSVFSAAGEHQRASSVDTQMQEAIEAASSNLATAMDLILPGVGSNMISDSLINILTHIDGYWHADPN